MTSYSITFGILFAAVAKSVWLNIVDLNWLSFQMALALGLLIASDTIYTSHVLEPHGNAPRVHYRFSLKLIDLANFMVLSAAIILIDPENNFFDVNARTLLNLFPKRQQTIFWVLVLIYCSLVLVWNEHAGILAEIQQRFIHSPSQWTHIFVNLFPWIVLLLVLAQALLSYGAGRGYECCEWLAIWTRLAVLIAFSVYLFVYKYLVVSQPPGSATKGAPRGTANDPPPAAV